MDRIKCSIKECTMSITKGFLSLEGCLLSGFNPLPIFRDRQKHKFPKNNGTMLPDELSHFGYESAFRILPYTMQDRYDRHRKMLQLPSIILENAHLRAEFLPGYGGRLYSLVDKSNGEELLFKNAVMQPANLAIRNAWFSGGIEWNIAQLGHTFSTCDDVFFARVTAADGYEFLRMYDYERTRGLIWQIDFHLPADARALAAHVTIMNDHSHKVPMYWWTNIAVREETGCRVFSGTKEVLYIEPASQDEGAEHCFGHGQLPFLPTLPQKDASYPLNFDFGNEFFFQNPKTETAPWQAISYENGYVFFERSIQPLRIRKMFCWGNHSGGRNWCDFLSNPGQGDYVEIQAGLAPTQLHGMEMAPKSRISFTQMFSALMISPFGGNSPDYEESLRTVSAAVEDALPAQSVLEADARYESLACLPCTELLHSGHGYGALENLRRRSEKQTPLPQHLLFPDCSLSDEQDCWSAFINGEKIKELSELELPLSYMTDMQYLPYLRDYCALHQDSATALLLLGVSEYENGMEEQAISHWRKALQIRRHPILWRNLAFAGLQSGSLTNALACMEEITWEEYLALDYAFLQEYFGLLILNQDFEKLFQKYMSLPDALKNEERLYLSACEAAMHLENWDFLLPAFEREYASIREGETKITNIWFRYAKAHQIDYSKLPKNLDLRMFE